MAADPHATTSALQAALDRELADLTAVLKAQKHFDARQIDAPVPATVDSSTAKPADELTSPNNSREGTPGSFGGPSPVLSRHSSIAQVPICGDWVQAVAALSGNVGRTLTCVRQFARAVAVMPQPHGAACQRQLELANWLHDRILSLLRGFADTSLAFSDEDVPAACGTVQRLVNANAALLMLDPPPEPRSWGEQAVQVLLYVFFTTCVERACDWATAAMAPMPLR